MRSYSLKQLGRHPRYVSALHRKKWSWAVRRAWFAFEYFTPGQETSLVTSTHVPSGNPGCLTLLNICSLRPYSFPSFFFSETIHEKRCNDCLRVLYANVLWKRLKIFKCAFPFTFIPINTATLAELISMR